MKSIGILLLAASTISLTACGTPDTVEGFIDDPAALQEVLQECMVEMAKGKPADEQCKTAQKAQVQMSKNMMKGIMGGLQ
jgi:hypothetical protein